MISLFKKSPIQKLKKLQISPTQYNYEDLTQVELTDTEELKLNYKRKFSGYFENDPLYDIIELVEFNDVNNKSLFLMSHLIEKKDIKNAVNTYFDVLGTDELEKGIWNINDLERFEKLDTNFPSFRIRNWVLNKNKFNYSVDLYVMQHENKFVLQVYSEFYKMLN